MRTKGKVMPHRGASRVLHSLPFRTMSAQTPTFSVVEATIADMQSAMQQRRTTSRAIVRQYLDRIAKYEDDAQRDHHPQSTRPRGSGRTRSRATAGKDSRAAARHSDRAQGQHPYDRHADDRAALRCSIGSFRRTRRRSPGTCVRQGAIIIAKTNMTELANWVAFGMPGNYNSLVGYGLNPYDPRRDPRPGTDDGRPALSTGGSSSGTGTAANFWAANVGNGNIRIDFESRPAGTISRESNRRSAASAGMV